MYFIAAFLGGLFDLLVAEYNVTEIVPGTPLLRVQGEIDECEIEAFRAAIASAEGAAKFGLIVELGEARLWTAAAYSSVIAAAARLAGCGKGPLLVVCPNDRLTSRVFGMLDFEHRLVETLVAAIATLRYGGASLAAAYAESFLRAAVS